MTHSKLNTEVLASSRKERGHDWSVVIGKAFFSGNALLESLTEIGATGHCSNKTPIRTGQEKMIQKSAPMAGHSTRDAGIELGAKEKMYFDEDNEERVRAGEESM